MRGGRTHTALLDPLLSLTGKRWMMEANDDGDPIVERLRLQRGITGDNGTSWHDPLRYPDAHKAAERVRAACRAGETIGLFGDYDCDGITASAQIVRMLRRRGVDPIVRLPHRVHDGYGLKSAHVEDFAAAGVTLLITVDTGVVAFEALERARERDIDVLILDHHHALASPHAFAVLHPALAEGFPAPHPAAAGVVFSFLHAVEGDDWTDRDTDLALAMLGTVADLVELRGANRRLVTEGLAALARLPEGPLRALAESVSRGAPLTSTDVAFRLAPRINAAGRMDDPFIALAALIDGGEALAALQTLNVRRQEETERAVAHALRTMEGEHGAAPPAFLTVASASYTPGIVGLIAGKLTERFGLPALAAHIAGDACTASLRAPPGYHVTEALGRAAHLLTSYGGHAQAAGATFPVAHAEALFRFLEEDADRAIAPADRSPVLRLDAVLPPGALSLELTRSLEALQPFGQGNPEPLFLLQGVRLADLRRVGADGKHLQARLPDAKCIGFGLGALIDRLAGPVDLAARIGIDTWNGRESVQVMVQDIRHCA